MNLWNSPDVKMTDKEEFVSNLICMQGEKALEVRPFREMTRVFILEMIMAVLYWTGYNP